MVKHPTSPLPVGRRRVTLYCPEILRAAACCIVDGLAVRGYDASLETGRHARGALKRSLRNKRGGLRVVCVERSMDERTQAKLRDALDPGGLGDLLIVPLQTPRFVLQRIERHFGVRPRRPTSRQTRMYLAHPTLVESSIDPRRMSAYGSASLGAAAAIAGALFLATGTSPAPQAATVDRGAPTEPVPTPTRPRIDDTVFAHAVSPTFEVPPSREEPRSPQDEEIIIIDEEALDLEAFDESTKTSEPAPLEVIQPNPRTADERLQLGRLQAAVPAASLVGTAIRTAAVPDIVAEPDPLSSSEPQIFSPFE